MHSSIKLAKDGKKPLTAHKPACFAGFTKAGQLKLVAGVLYGNTDADATAEFSIALTGITTLANTDFVL